LQTAGSKRRAEILHGCKPSSEGLKLVYHSQTNRALHLDKCCEYWYFNFANKDNPNPEEFKFPVEMALELLIAADFLDCKPRILFDADGSLTSSSIKMIPGF